MCQRTLCNRMPETLSPEPYLDPPTTLYCSPYLPLNENYSSPLKGTWGVLVKKKTLGDQALVEPSFSELLGELLLALLATWGSGISGLWASGLL